MNSNNIILSQINDKIEQCKSGYYITNTHFLDLHEQSLVNINAHKRNSENRDVNLFLYGGYPDAERKILIAAPSDIYGTLPNVLDIETFLTVIRITAPAGAAHLTHRNYLGSILSLGLDRNVIGDILVYENGADMIVINEIADFILTDYDKAGCTNITLEPVPMSSLKTPEYKTEIIRDTVPSLRLDNVLSSAFKISRSDAAYAVKSGLVFVDNEKADKINRKVSEGSVLVLRKKGKSILKSIGSTSKKGRLWIEIEHYI